MVIDRDTSGTRRQLARRSFFVMLSIALATSVPPSNAADGLAAGTYRQVSPYNGRILAIGNELVVANDGYGPRRFSLNAVRPSDNNLGYVGGTLVPKAGLQIWSSKRIGARCLLTFTPLAHGKLKITQNLGFGDCGFGYGVSASGTYARTTATGKLGPWNGP